MNDVFLDTAAARASVRALVFGRASPMSWDELSCKVRPHGDRDSAARALICAHGQLWQKALQSTATQRAPSVVSRYLCNAQQFSQSEWCSRSRHPRN